MSSARFEKAYSDMGRFKKEASAAKITPSNDEQLNLYAWAKIAKGESTAGQSRPGVFSPVQRAKFDAWQKAEKEGITAKEAEQKYIALAEDLLKRGFPDA